MGKEICSNCKKEIPEEEFKWNDGMCSVCFDEKYVDEVPIWDYFDGYNWNKP